MHIRNSIAKEVQGCVRGITGVILQLGYVLAYAVSGVLADYIFELLLEKNGGIFFE